MNVPIVVVLVVWLFYTAFFSLRFSFNKEMYDDALLIDLSNESIEHAPNLPFLG